MTGDRVPFDWCDYLEIARYLNQGPPPALAEAAGRCAVSRAYYASFGHARRYASRYLGFRPLFRAKDHELLAVHLRQRGMDDVADELEALRLWRNECDYDDTVGALSLLVTNAIEGADRVLLALR